MIITYPMAKEHLKTSQGKEIIDKLTNIGLEVEGIKNSDELSDSKIAKILKVETPNADKLKVCDVTLGGSEIFSFVGANARDGLITIYAPPGAIIPKTKFQLKIAKIRGVSLKECFVLKMN